MASGARSNIKKEPGMDDEMEARIVSLCEDHPEGINSEMMRSAIPQASSAQCVTVLNALLKAGRIKVFKKKIQGKDELLYRLQDSTSASSAVKGADMEEKLLYQVIADAGNKGIWMRDIRMKTNLAIAQLNKLLKTMISKKLVKAVQCVSAARKKVYMLFELEPDSSVTGGTWYSGETFDHEFADVLNQQCFRFLEKKAAVAKERFSDNDPLSQYNAGLASAKEVHDHITQLGISAVKLSMKDIVDVLRTLVYDGKAKEVSTVSTGSAQDEGDKMYRVARPLIQTTGLMRVPCGYCPLIDECRDEGPISPRTCSYMKEWMEKVDF
ncbi:DNA-directed RNA polymerase III subunit RPC6-like [Babylonia areolata]|uniref:DNA-directed RNA polymerase III subunit RPC6-like n=1 Tax=Babylonia areolata TaxID=304850 RepID=UPI003FCF1B32